MAPGTRRNVSGRGCRHFRLGGCDRVGQGVVIWRVVCRKQVNKCRKKFNEDVWSIADHAHSSSSSSSSARRSNQPGLTHGVSPSTPAAASTAPSASPLIIGASTRRDRVCCKDRDAHAHLPLRPAECETYTVEESALARSSLRKPTSPPIDKHSRFNLSPREGWGGVVGATVRQC